MYKNLVWDVVELLEKSKSIDCKWLFKTKRGFKGKIENHKVRLVIKRFAKKIKIKLTIRKHSLMYLEKDSYIIPMTLVSYFNLELH